MRNLHRQKGLKRMKKTHDDDSVSYWQSSTDLMAALVFILILIILFLGAFMYTGKMGNKRGSGDGNSHPQTVQAAATPTATPTPTPTPTPVPQEGGGGDQTQDQDTDTKPQTDDNGKAAVYVQVVDRETGKAIREKGVTFQIYANSSLMTLYHYYPEKKGYTDYQTTEKGDFYLPEKIEEGEYELKETTEPKGYDSADAIDVKADAAYDWNAPLVVKVALTPSQNVIRVTVKDADGQGVEGYRFRIQAAEDVTTADGTLRFQKGETAGTVTTDEDGKGTSRPLYLGNYELISDSVPTYYAEAEGDTAAEVEKKTGQKPAAHVFTAEKTALHLTLSDETSAAKTLSGVTFTLTNRKTGRKQTAQTDDDGALTFDEMEKDTSYILAQETALTDYTLPKKTQTITVDEYGLIDGKAVKDLTLTNRMIRVSVLVRDAVLRDPVEGLSASLGDETWTTGIDTHTLTGLKPGTYTLTVGNIKETAAVRDTAEEQTVTVTVMTMRSYVVLAGFAAGLAALGAVVIWLIRRRKWKNSRKAD